MNLSWFQRNRPVTILMNQQFAPEQLEGQSALDLRNIDKKSWNLVVSRTQAIELSLYHVTADSLLGIDKLHKTLRLAIEWATKISDLGPVFRMEWLESLHISDFRLLRSIAGIESLQSLTELHLSGSRGSLNPPLRLSSIKPVARLQNLKTLVLENVSLEDDDVTPIASISTLEQLGIAHNFDRKQLAFLARRLNAQLKTPITACVETQLHCSRCGIPQFLFTGRRMPLVCRNCDNVKFDKLMLQFEELQYC